MDVGTSHVVFCCVVFCHVMSCAVSVDVVSCQVSSFRVVSFGFVFVVILRLVGFVCMVSGFDVVIAVLMRAVLVDDDDVVSMIGFVCMLG